MVEAEARWVKQQEEETRISRPHFEEAAAMSDFTWFSEALGNTYWDATAKCQGVV